MNFYVFGAVLLSTTVNAVAQNFLRKSLIEVGPISRLQQEPLNFILMAALNSYFLLGLFCYVFSLLAWLYVLAQTEVSVAYPFASLGFVIAAVVGYYFLGEDLSYARLAGIGLVCAGLALIARSA